MNSESFNQEAARLEALRQYQILDTEPEEAYDNLAQLAAFTCGTPIVLVNFIDEDRQWFKAKLGLDVRQMPRDVGLSYLCQERRDFVIVPDTLADENLATNPVVTSYPYVRFYAGVPLITPTGDIVGTLCVIDNVPRELNEKQIEVLLALGRQVISQLELRRNLAEVSRYAEELKQAEDELKRQHLRSQLFAEITLKIRESLQLDEILQTTVIEVQKLLHADRVLIFRLWPDGSGTVVQEAVLPGWPVVLGKNILDDCFHKNYLEKYRQGRVSAIVDIEHADIQACHREFLQQFGVRANLVVPILVREGVWGLLIAHQCAAPREWSNFELDLLQQLANQIGIALSQAQLLEQETRQRQELARSNAELEQFAYVASHDLQEPLRMVTSYLQLLERKYKNQLDSNAEQFITYAVDGARRMQTLINDLLNYSRVSSRGQPFVEVDCTDIFHRAIANLKIAIEESGVVITHDPLPVVLADPTQLTQVFQNLIANAIKFRGSSPPRIHIRAVRGAEGEFLPSHSSLAQPPANANSTKSHEWVFSVHDNGIGIETQYAERIFVIFQRLHGRSKYPGTGIGLAICKKIIERHNGCIWVESELGQGSIFYFTIPDKALRTGVKSREVEKKNDRKMQRLSRVFIIPQSPLPLIPSFLPTIVNSKAIMPIEVLLVEDNPGDAQLTRIALEESKISINLNVVEDGVEAMAFLRKQEKYAVMPRPDMVLLDLNLPRKDGREVLAEIKTDITLKRIPVVVLTTSQAEEDILRAYNLAANCYITKPVDFDQFVKIVQSIEHFWFAIVKLPPE